MSNQPPNRQPPTLEGRDKAARAALEEDALSLTPFYAVLAVVSIVGAYPLGGLSLLAASLIFWAIAISAWVIHARLTEIRDLLRSRDK